MKRIILAFFLILFQFIFGDDDLFKNFTRSRYSLRRLSRKSTTTEIPLNETESVSELSFWQYSTEGYSEEIFENQTEISIEKKLINNIEENLSKQLICGESDFDDIPWIVVLEQTDPSGRDNRKTLSKGVLIDEKHVLTTVSSIHNTHPFWVVSGVRLGDIPTWMNESIERNHSFANIISVGIDKIFLHESKDIAIIRLSQKINFTDTIYPICLPIDDNYNFQELFLHICKRNHRKYDIQLTSAKPLSPQDCNTMFHRKGAEFSLEEFCAWDEYGDNCTGDLGGPLMGKLYGKYMVIGLHSYAVAEENFDATAYPGVYVRVGSHLKWIKNILQLNEIDNNEIK